MADIIVKLNYPESWDRQWGGNMFLWETKNRLGKLGNYKFEINNDVRNCDIWIIYDDHSSYQLEHTICNFGICIFITGEVKDQWEYPQKYLNQFDAVITARNDISHKNIISAPHMCVWHIKKDLDYLVSLKPPLKTNFLSTITSTAENIPGHKLRLDFIKNFKDKSHINLDWFGRGVKPIDDKWDALASYKYSIAIENSSYEDYFTEKILDCFLSYTIPFYFGCKNIGKYFPEGSFVSIDPNDVNKSISIIHDTIENNHFEKNLNALQEARELVFTKYGLFPSLKEILDQETKKLISNNHKRVLSRNPMLSKNDTIKQKLNQIKNRAMLNLSGYR